MLNNKVLVNLYCLSLGKTFEVYLPINEKIGNITKILNTTLFDSIDSSRNYMFLNSETGNIYKNNELIRETDIKNGTKIILM